MERLHYITHTVPRYTLFDQIDTVLKAGVKWIQFRQKDKTDRAFEEEAKVAQQLVKAHQGTFIVNDRVMIAKAIDADGVHIGKEDMPPVMARKILGPAKIIGCTANSFDDIYALRDQPIDYIGLGPFRFTSTKQNLSPILGLNGYIDILQRMKVWEITIPLIAIGGIQQTDIPALLLEGIYGIALSSAIIQNDRPTVACHAILNEINSALL